MSATGRGGRYEALSRYYTPAAVALACARVLPIRAGQHVMEAHVGAGSWVEALERLNHERDLGLTLELLDLDPWAAGLDRSSRIILARRSGDFLQTDPVQQPDWIIGNPPFAVSAVFAYHHLPYLHVPASREKPVPVAHLHIRKALHDVRPGGGVAFILRLGFSGSEQREQLFRDYPPAEIRTLVPRPPFTGNGQSDSCEFALFVWRKDWGVEVGDTRWQRLCWR